MSDTPAVPPRRRGLPLAKVPEAPAAPSLTTRLETLRDRLALLDEGRVRDLFSVPATAELLKTTISLCPVCVAHVPAAIFRSGTRVLMHKQCETHGHSVAVVENDVRYFMLSNRDRWGRRYAELPEHFIPDISSAPGQSCCEGGACGPTSEATDQTATKTCTVLVEVTDACNLACPVCYSDAKGDRMLPFEEFKANLLRMLSVKGTADSVQLTGGEATMHPQFWEMVEFLYHETRVKRVYLPTNGILFARPEMARKLLPFRDKVMVLLQFDGLSAQTDERMRDARLARVRQRVVENINELGIAMQLTMTLARGVNLHEVGAVVDLGLRHENIRLVALQPATYSGRYDLTQDPLERLTLSDVAEAVMSHARLRMRRGDFAPIPCSHPGCGWITLFYRRFGLHENVVKYIDLDKVLDTVASKTVLNRGEIQETVSSGGGNALRKLAGQAIAQLVRPRDIFSVAVKPFMDRFSYDQDRISSCCHHTLDTHGELVSFCEYNARLRPRDSWSRFPTMPARAVTPGES